MPTQMPSTGRPPGEPTADDLVAVHAPEPGHAGGEGADAGHDQAVAVQRVGRVPSTGSTSAPARSRARTAERRLPDP